MTDLIVYVRKSPDGRRRLSFAQPAEIPQADLLAAGYAFDGNSCVRDVTEADLREVELALIQFSEAAGFKVRFV